MAQNNKNTNQEPIDTAVEIDLSLADVDEKEPRDSTLKKRLTHPAKAVIGGISHGAKAVKQSAKTVKGGISQVENGLNDVSDKLTKVPGVSQGVSIFADYRKFLDRGNVIDLAVAVVIGAAFTGIVESMVKDIISPILSLASGRALEENFVVLRKDEAFPNPDYSTRATVKESNALSWNYGNFIQTVINFFIISACVFVIVKLYQMGRNTKTAVTEKKCPYCAEEIGLDAIRCPKCTCWLDLNAYVMIEAELARRLREGISSNIDSYPAH
ncbi:hypothetical protein BGZ50_002373 [Haplosporangium sp. Z 11]|nr:hypothetical protein BGZ50_002373 [Haplosporangium sp. Z 11]